MFSIFFSHICVAVIATLCAVYWQSLKKKSHIQVESSKRYKVALVYGHDIYFHERAARGFIAAPDNNLYDIKKYVVSSLDALVLRQIAQAIIDDKPDIIVPIGTSVSRAIVSVLKSRKELIPVVFVGVSQADKVGLVHSLKSRDAMSLELQRLEKNPPERLIFYAI